MRIRLTRLDERRHALDIERADGSRERAELETRSTLRHDLTHLALEEAAGLDDGFFGALARGSTLAELSGAIHTGRMLEIERAVAVLQGMTRDGVDPRALHARIVESHAIQGAAPPAWLTEELVVAVHAAAARPPRSLGCHARARDAGAHVAGTRRRRRARSGSRRERVGSRALLTRSADPQTAAR